METAEKNKIEPGVLYLVATPLGNLADISARALKILGGVDFIAAEDTRVAAKLLGAFGMTKSMMPYHDHNSNSAGEVIIKRLRDGMSCALVTDAGMPAISDPGQHLVKKCAENGIKVTVSPGPCAAVTALALSGLDTRRFIFEGFLEGSDNEKREHLKELYAEKRTLIFYEAPHRMPQTLKLLADELGDRPIAICRELTKLNEEIERTSLRDAAEEYVSKECRGEYVIVVGGAPENAGAFWAEMSISEHVAYYTDVIKLDKMSAVKAVSKDRGLPKNQVYKELLN